MHLNLLFIVIITFLFVFVVIVQRFYLWIFFYWFNCWRRFVFRAVTSTSHCRHVECALPAGYAPFRWKLGAVYLHCWQPISILQPPAIDLYKSGRCPLKSSSFEAFFFKSEIGKISVFFLVFSGQHFQFLGPEMCRYFDYQVKNSQNFGSKVNILGF